MYQWIENQLKALNLVSDMTQKNGFTRLAFTEEEAAAKEAFKSIAKNLGLKITEDKAGNIWAVWQVYNSEEVIAIGSHLDTVYQGGGYDGVVGVLSGLALIKMMQDDAQLPSKNIAIIVFSAEESARFSISTIGSKAIAGLLNLNELENIQDKDGITLKEAVKSSGLNWSDLPQAEKAPYHIDYFMEVHIEQSNHLNRNQKSIGIVEKIARPTRLQINVTGETNHTGTTEMTARADALVSIAPLITQVEKIAVELNKQHARPVVATVSTLDIAPNAMNMIPSHIRLGIDIRSTEQVLKDKVVNAIQNEIKQIEQNTKVSIKIKTLANDQPVSLDPSLITKIESACKVLDIPYQRMHSGAGHDAMNMATKYKSALIFIPCKDGLSHHPKEYASTNDILQGVLLLKQCVENK